MSSLNVVTLRSYADAMMDGIDAGTPGVREDP